MAFVTLENGAQMQLVWGNATVRWTNTLHITKTGFSEEDCAALKDALVANLTAVVSRPWAQGYKLLEVVFYDQRAQTAPVYRYTVDAVAGTSTGEITDKSSAIVVTFRTPVRGRAGRGRMYLGGNTEGNMAAGVWTSTVIANALLVVGAIFNAVEAQGWNAVIKSTQLNHVPHNPAWAYPITSYTIRNNIPGSQDRRNHRP